MKALEDEALSDQEFSEMLAAWNVPEPSSNLRARIFGEKRKRGMRVEKSAFELPACVEEPWYRSLLSSNGGRQDRAILGSLLLQAAGVAVLFLATHSPLSQNFVRKHEMSISLALYRPKLRVTGADGESRGGGGGGGGQHALKPASKGTAPPLAVKQFIPPAVALAMPRLHCSQLSLLLGRPLALRTTVTRSACYEWFSGPGFEWTR